MTTGWPRQSRPLPLWLAWALVNSVGAGLVGLIQGTLFIDPTSGSWPLLGPLLGAPVMGLLQGIVIRSQLGRGRDWALATAIGMVLGVAAGGLFSFIALEMMQRLATGNILLVLSGLPLGAAVQGWVQSRLLRSRLARPGLWMAVCALAWVINLVPFLVVGVATLSLTSQSLPGFWALNGLISGAVVGLVSGTGLAILLSEGRSPNRRP